MTLLTLQILGAVALVVCIVLYYLRIKARREQYIRRFMFPPGVFAKFHQARPTLGIKEQQLVARALRQFFLAYYKGGYQRVAMPSQVVDDLWHEFILFTREYRSFCDAAFGNFLHHTPAVAMGAVKSDNEGLRRVWWFTCLEENINPRKATRLPLLFAIDHKLGISDGFVYSLDGHKERISKEAMLTAAQAGGAVGVAMAVDAKCAASFIDDRIDGTTNGLGGTAGDRRAGCGGGGAGAASDGGDGGGGCSGGCGGGCGGG